MSLVVPGSRWMSLDVAGGACGLGFFSVSVPETAGRSTRPEREDGARRVRPRDRSARWCQKLSRRAHERNERTTMAEVTDSPVSWVADHTRRYLETGGEDGHEWRP